MITTFTAVGAENPTKLIVFLHGYGANGANLKGMAVELQRSYMINALCLLPDAPHHYEGGGYGHQWFSLMNRDLDFLRAGIDRVLPALEEFIAAHLARHHLVAERDLFIVGFSQGAMLGYYYSLTHPVFAMLGYSGALVPPLTFSAHRCRNFLLYHGDHDDVVNPGALEEARKYLQSIGLDPSYNLEQELDHSISYDGIKRGGEFCTDLLTGAR